MPSPLILDVPNSFRLAATVESHGWYLLAPFNWDAASETLSRPEALSEGLVIQLQVRQRGRSIEVGFTPRRGVSAEEITRRVSRMLQLHVDLDEFHRRCSRRKSHRAAAEMSFGRLLCGTTRFEDAVRIITTTNTAWRQTMRMNALLVEHFGRTGRRGRAFPLPQDLAAAPVEELQAKCRLGYRAATIHRLAAGVADGSIPLEGDLSGRDTEEMDRLFRSLPGIGPYGSAHLLAMEGRHDWIAVDTEFRRYVRENHFGGDDVTDQEMVAVYERWGRWKYLAYWWELWSEVRETVSVRGE